MIYTIQNEQFKVDISDFKAEIQSICSKSTGVEYIWQGNQPYWTERAIPLFPFCGRLYNGEYTYKGRTYKIANHGFLRDRVLSLKSITENEIVLTLSADEETRKCYPFDFTVDLNYSIYENLISTKFVITNNSNDSMFFSVGGHPGFNIPFCGGKFDDYSVEFPNAINPQLVELTEACFITGNNIPYEMRDGKYIDLYHEMFDDDAKFFKNSGGTAILRNRNVPNKSIVVDYSLNNCPYVGLWHTNRTEAPFVCIEPWHGLPSRTGFVEEISERDAIISLDGKKKYVFSFNIIINE